MHRNPRKIHPLFPLFPLSSLKWTALLLVVVVVGRGGGGALALIALHLPLVTYSLKGLPISGVVSLGSLKFGNFSSSRIAGKFMASVASW